MIRFREKKKHNREGIAIGEDWRCCKRDCNPMGGSKDTEGALGAVAGGQEAEGGECLSSALPLVDRGLLLPPLERH